MTAPRDDVEQASVLAEVALSAARQADDLARTAAAAAAEAARLARLALEVAQTSYDHVERARGR